MPKIAMENTGNNWPAIKFKIKGKDYLFLVDTGADRTTVIKELIPESSPLSREGYVLGAGGPAPAMTYSVRSFNILGVSLRSVMCDDTIYLMSQRLGVTFGGLIGQDVLRQFSSITFDYTNKVIDFKK